MTLPNESRAPGSASHLGSRTQRINPSLAQIRKRFLATDSRTVAVAAVFGALLVFLTAVPLCALMNVWIDEAFTLHTTGAGVAFAWQQAKVFEDQPPLYFLLEASWRTINETSIVFARFPSVVFAAGTVAVIVAMAHRIVPRVPPMAVALVTALNPIIIWAASEMRVYALVLLLGSALVWTFFTAFLVPQPSQSARICYVVLAIVGLYTQYYVGFVLVAQGITLFAVRRGTVRAFIGAMAIVAVAFAPFIPIAIGHIEASGGFVVHRTPLEAVYELVNNAIVYVLPHEIGWSGLLRILGIAIAAILLITLFVFGRPSFERTADRGVVLQWIVCLVVFSLLFAAAGIPLPLQRHIVVLAPSSMLLAILLVGSLSRHRALISGAAFVVFIAFASITLATHYKPPLAKLGDWRRVATTLEAEPVVPIAVFPAELGVPLNVYLPRPLIQVPAPMPFTDDYVQRSTLISESEVADVLDPVAAKSGRLWIVTASVCSRVNLEVYDYHCRFLEQYMNRHYNVVKTIAFRGALARLFIRSSIPPAKMSAKQNAS